MFIYLLTSDNLYVRQRRKQVVYSDSSRECSGGGRAWIGINEYILELLPEIIVGIDGISRYREEV